MGSDYYLSNSFMMTYFCMMAVIGLAYAVPVVAGIRLACRNKALPAGHKAGWIISFLLLSVVALLAYLVVYAAPGQRRAE